MLRKLRSGLPHLRSTGTRKITHFPTLHFELFVDYLHPVGTRASTHPLPDAAFPASSSTTSKCRLSALPSGVLLRLLPRGPTPRRHSSPRHRSSPHHLLPATQPRARHSSLHRPSPVWQDARTHPFSWHQNEHLPTPLGRTSSHVVDSLPQCSGQETWTKQLLGQFNTPFGFVVAVPCDSGGGQRRHYIVGTGLLFGIVLVEILVTSLSACGDCVCGRPFKSHPCKSPGTS